MNETRNQQEPSMEEILASIRRIISEDGQDPRATTEPEKAEEAEAESRFRPEAAEAGDKPADPGSHGTAGGGEAGGDADILVLTEMLAEDGSVISLAARSSAAGASDPDLSITPETPDLPEPPGGPDDTMVGAPDRPADAEPPHRPERIDPGDGPPDADSGRPQAERPPPPSGADEQMENETVSNETRKKLDLVSEEAETASTAALVELAQTVARSKDMPLGGGRMVEDLVREALQPMLREWLDANLPALVERLVRSEIQRIVRRAEDNA